MANLLLHEKIFHVKNKFVINLIKLFAIYRITNLFCK